MVTPETMVGAVILAVIASTGFWTLITHIYDSKHSNNTAVSKMLKGLGHDRICTLGEEYLKRGYITKDEYENLNDYLYKPYKALGGNGTAEKVMKEVDDLSLLKDNKEE